MGLLIQVSELNPNVIIPGTVAAVLTALVALVGVYFRRNKDTIEAKILQSGDERETNEMLRRELRQTHDRYAELSDDYYSLQRRSNNDILTRDRYISLLVQSLQSNGINVPEWFELPNKD